MGGNYKICKKHDLGVNNTSNTVEDDFKKVDGWIFYIDWSLWGHSDSYFFLKMWAKLEQQILQWQKSLLKRPKWQTLSSSSPYCKLTVQLFILMNSYLTACTVLRENYMTECKNRKPNSRQLSVTYIKIYYAGLKSTPCQSSLKTH